MLHVHQLQVLYAAQLPCYCHQSFICHLCVWHVDLQYRRNLLLVLLNLQKQQRIRNVKGNLHRNCSFMRLWHTWPSYRYERGYLVLTCLRCGHPCVSAKMPGSLMKAQRLMSSSTIFLQDAATYASPTDVSNTQARSSSCIRSRSCATDIKLESVMSSQ
jgi:hypothetical protein